MWNSTITLTSTSTEFTHWNSTINTSNTFIPTFHIDHLPPFITTITTTMVLQYIPPMATLQMLPASAALLPHPLLLLLLLRPRPPPPPVSPRCTRLPAFRPLPFTTATMFPRHRWSAQRCFFSISSDRPRIVSTTFASNRSISTFQKLHHFSHDAQHSPQWAIITCTIQATPPLSLLLLPPPLPHLLQAVETTTSTVAASSSRS